MAPAAIATVRNAEVLADEAYRRRVLAKIPAGFVREPGDCAGLAVLLNSEAGRYVTSQTITEQGGYF